VEDTARAVMERCDVLASISEESGLIVRPYGSRAMNEANDVVHIEQGPVLGERDLPVGVVTAINGQSRVKVGFVGNAGHAGTVPMEGRRDALWAAAEFVLEVEAAAKADPGAVATVGKISAHPGAVNVIPGRWNTPWTSATQTTQPAGGYATTSKRGQAR
jgi:acetylornithine deacetylase/succinyl-diaminopimelate desuccinylase-like protein